MPRLRELMETNDIVAQLGAQHRRLESAASAWAQAKTTAVPLAETINMPLVWPMTS